MDDALDGSCAGSLTDAMTHAAQALCIPIEAVWQALQGTDTWCCERGENQGQTVCDECAEAWGSLPA